MIWAEEVDGGWFAHYSDRDDNWRIALDALGREIICHTEALALSVARYRRKRIRIWK